ncbi:MAG: NUDIX hydrolase [Granulosicoccaceae bacterium]|jgi:ADP-ribose pyrophosphatase
MQGRPEVTRRQAIYNGKVIDLGTEQLTLPNGNQCELEIIRHPGGAVALAVDAQQRVCLLRQYRHAAGGWLWEFPGGRIEPGESALLSAQRELREEAGVEAGQWRAVIDFYSTPGFCDERLYLFLASDLQHVASAAEADEVLEVHWLELYEALGLIRSGEIIDAKTIIGLYRLDELLRVEAGRL